MAKPSKNKNRAAYKNEFVSNDAANGIALPILRVDSADYNIEEMSREDLLSLKLRLESDMTYLKNQRYDAKRELIVTGKYADPNWYFGLEYIIKAKGLQVQAILNELGKRKQSIPNLSDYFVEVARERLSDDGFRELMATAQRRRQTAIQAMKQGEVKQGKIK